MKKTIFRLNMFLLITIFIALSTVSVYAVNVVDPQMKSSLALQYKYDDEYLEGVEIKTYRIAEVFADGTFALCGQFKDYPVNIQGVTSKNEWNDIASTLSAFVAADNLEPTYSEITNSNGTVEFKDILPGFYLTLSVEVEAPKQTIIFDSFLTVLPQKMDDGAYNYDVVAYPKGDIYIPQEKDISKKVVKQWKDSGFTEKRPEYIEVDILKDGVIQSTQKLSSENNWSYSWTVKDDGSKWQAVERKVAEKYTVTVVEDGNTIIVTNAYVTTDDGPPKTGYTFILWPYILGLCISGGALITLAAWRKRSE